MADQSSIYELRVDAAQFIQGLNQAAEALATLQRAAQAAGQAQEQSAQGHATASKSVEGFGAAVHGANGFLQEFAATTTGMLAGLAGFSILEGITQSLKGFVGGFITVNSAMEDMNITIGALQENLKGAGDETELMAKKGAAAADGFNKKWREVTEERETLDRHYAERHDKIEEELSDLDGRQVDKRQRLYAQASEERDHAHQQAVLHIEERETDADKKYGDQVDERLRIWRLAQDELARKHGETVSTLEREQHDLDRNYGEELKERGANWALHLEEVEAAHARTIQNIRDQMADLVQTEADQTFDLGQRTNNQLTDLDQRTADRMRQLDREARRPGTTTAQRQTIGVQRADLTRSTAEDKARIERDYNQNLDRIKRDNVERLAILARRITEENDKYAEQQREQAKRYELELAALAVHHANAEELLKIRLGKEEDDYAHLGKVVDDALSVDIEKLDIQHAAVITGFQNEHDELDREYERAGAIRDNAFAIEIAEMTTQEEKRRTQRQTELSNLDEDYADALKKLVEKGDDLQQEVDKAVIEATLPLQEGGKARGLSILSRLGLDDASLEEQQRAIDLHLIALTKGTTQNLEQMQTQFQALFTAAIDPTRMINFVKANGEESTKEISQIVSDWVAAWSRFRPGVQEEIETILRYLSNGEFSRAFMLARRLGISEDDLEAVGLHFDKMNKLVSAEGPVVDSVLRAVEKSFGDVAPKMAKGFGGLLTNLQDFIQGVQLVAGDELFKNVNKALTDLYAALTDENDPGLRNKILNIATAVGTFLAQIIAFGAEILPILFGLKTSADEDLTPLQTVLLGVGDAIAGLSAWLDEHGLSMARLFEDIAAAIGILLGVAALGGLVAFLGGGGVFLVTIAAVIVAVEGLRRAWEEDWGGIREAAAAVSDWITDVGLPAFHELVDWLGDNVVPVIVELAKQVGEGLLAAFTAFGEWMQETGFPALHTLEDWVREHVLPALQELSGWVSQHVVTAFQELSDWLAGHVQPTLNELGDWLTNTGLPAWRTFSEWLREEVVPVLKQIAEWVGDHVMPLLASLGELVAGALYDAFRTVAGFLGDSIIGSLHLLSLAFQGVASDIQAVIGFVNQLMPILQPLVGMMSTFGGQLSTALVQGANAGIDENTAAYNKGLVDLAEGGIQAVKDDLEIKSPSAKWMREVGIPAGQGYEAGVVAGIQAAQPEIDAALAASVASETDAIGVMQANLLEFAANIDRAGGAAGALLSGGLGGADVGKYINPSALTEGAGGNLPARGGKGGGGSAALIEKYASGAYPGSGLEAWGLKAPGETIAKIFGTTWPYNTSGKYEGSTIAERPIIEPTVKPSTTGGSGTAGGLQSYYEQFLSPEGIAIAILGQSGGTAAQEIQNAARAANPDWYDQQTGLYIGPGTDAWSRNNPMMAEGGIVTQATTMTAGEAGREAILPLPTSGVPVTVAHFADTALMEWYNRFVTVSLDLTARIQATITNAQNAVTTAIAIGTQATRDLLPLIVPFSSASSALAAMVPAMNAVRDATLAGTVAVQLLTSQNHIDSGILNGALSAVNNNLAVANFYLEAIDTYASYIHTDLSSTIHTDLLNVKSAISGTGGTTSTATLDTIHTDLASTLHLDLGYTLHGDLATTLHTDLATTLHADLIGTVGSVRAAILGLGGLGGGTTTSTDTHTDLVNILNAVNGMSGTLHGDLVAMSGGLHGDLGQLGTTNALLQTANRILGVDDYGFVGGRGINRLIDDTLFTTGGGSGFIDVALTPTVRTLAGGGIVTQATGIIAGEAGPEAILPLPDSGAPVQIAHFSDDALRELAAAQVGGSSGPNYTLNYEAHVETAMGNAAAEQLLWRLEEQARGRI